MNEDWKRPDSGWTKKDDMQPDSSDLKAQRIALLSTRLVAQYALLAQMAKLLEAASYEVNPAFAKQIDAALTEYRRQHP